jgi:hypothetical protein
MQIHMIVSPHDRRFAMKTLTSTNTLAHRWVLISAGILLCANGAIAGPPAGDAQQQARDLLSGTANGLAGSIDKLPAVVADGHSRGDHDPQEQARQMILGTASYGSVAGTAVASTPAVPARTNHRTYSDPQERARRLLLAQASSEIVSSERSAPVAKR